MEIEEITVNDKSGLHLRPAAKFVETCSKFKCQILVKNITQDSSYKNAKSTIDVMTLGVEQGHKISIKAEGEDEKEAIQTIIDLITKNFES